ncbi:MAG: hypothetical protein IT443_11515 [Phycisphaeraceae bacterium]|nr:hypothetical protein [Phycisphaeraceae bacterium]
MGWGCAGSKQGAATRPAERLAVWPGPPAAARIALVDIQDGTTKPKSQSFWDRIGSGLVGARRQAMVRPVGVAVAEERWLYVTDQELQAIHVIDMPKRSWRLIARVGDSYLVSPVGLAACGENIAVSDSVLKKVFILTRKGKLVRTIEKPGGFGRPTGMAFDANAKALYVVDTTANEICAFDMQGTLLRRFGTSGLDPVQFNYPTHVWVDGAGKLYVTDSLNFRLQILTAEGQFVGQIGQIGDASGYMAVPKGIAVDGLGHIYVVDSYFSAVQIFDQAGRFLLSLGGPGSELGQFEVPTGLTMDQHNRLYVCDTFNARVQVFQYVGDTDHEETPTTAP